MRAGADKKKTTASALERWEAIKRRARIRRYYDAPYDWFDWGDGEPLNWIERPRVNLGDNPCDPLVNDPRSQKMLDLLCMGRMLDAIWP